MERYATSSCFVKHVFSLLLITFMMSIRMLMNNVNVVEAGVCKTGIFDGMPIYFIKDYRAIVYYILAIVLITFSTWLGKWDDYSKVSIGVSWLFTLLRIAVVFSMMMTDRICIFESGIGKMFQIGIFAYIIMAQIISNLWFFRE